MAHFSNALLAGLLVGGLAASAQTPVTLKDAYRDVMLIGAAISPAQHTGRDARGIPIIKAQFNSITPENILKWERVHPKPGVYSFDLPDSYVAFGEQNQMFIVGHCLVWHSQTPAWVFRDDKGALLDRDALLARMRDHIMTVVGRYKGRIHSWDVVNEALEEDGTLRQSLWMKIIGEDYIAKALQYAHEADPQAELTYNDYSLENEAKRRGAVALITKLKAQGVPVTSIGTQHHDNLEWPSLDQVDATLTAFGKLGVKVSVTEMDIDVLPQAAPRGSADVSLKVEAKAQLNPYVNGLPEDVERKLTERWAGLFRVFAKHRDVVRRVTLWGVTDADSWKNNWPVPGRTNYPLLFDRKGAPKPAVDAVIRVVRPS